MVRGDAPGRIQRSPRRLHASQPRVAARLDAEGNLASSAPCIPAGWWQDPAKRSSEEAGSSRSSPCGSQLSYAHMLLCARLAPGCRTKGRVRQRSSSWIAPCLLRNISAVMPGAPVQTLQNRSPVIAVHLTSTRPDSWHLSTFDYRAVLNPCCCVRACLLEMTGTDPPLQTSGSGERHCLGIDLGSVIQPTLPHSSGAVARGAYR